MADESQVIINSSIAMMVLSTVAVALRFWSRALQPTGKKFWWDDWSALLLLPIALTLSALAIGWAELGLGQHTYEVLEKHPENLVPGLKYLFWGSFVYEIGIAAAKFSALLFYIRVFRLDGPRWWRIAIFFSLAFSAAFTVFSFFLTIFQCRPVSGAWNKETQPPPQCLKPVDFFMTTSCINFVNDLVIVIIPIPCVFRLNMTRVKKFLVAGVLMCGYVTVFMTIGQIVLVSINSDKLEQDVFYYAAPIMSWGNCQPSVALISLCLPSIFHLGNRLVKYGPTALVNTGDPSMLASHGKPRASFTTQPMSQRSQRASLVRQTEDLSSPRHDSRGRNDSFDEQELTKDGKVGIYEMLEYGEKPLPELPVPARTSSRKHIAEAMAREDV